MSVEEWPPEGSIVTSRDYPLRGGANADTQAIFGGIDPETNKYGLLLYGPGMGWPMYEDTGLRGAWFEKLLKEYPGRTGRWVYKNSITVVSVPLLPASKPPPAPQPLPTDLAFFASRQDPAECPCGRFRIGCPYHDPGGKR